MTWWKEFFSGPYLDVQKQFSAEQQNIHQADFIVDALEISPPASVLDVPCGEGRISIEMALRGFIMTGVDITAEFLEDAERKAVEKNVDVTWKHKDMRDLPWKEKFDGVFCFCGSFGYFDDAENTKFLEAVHNTLKPGGTFLVDTLAAEALFPIFQERDWHKTGDTWVLQKRHFNIEKSRIEAEWTFIKHGKVTTKCSSMRVYTYREICKIVKGAGFSVYKSYGSLDKDPVKLGAKRLYICAKKCE
ncbi:MAG: methyltransferase domain-containing protein [Candidatus Methanofastidiosia archaeon]